MRVYSYLLSHYNLQTHSEILGSMLLRLIHLIELERCRFTNMEVKVVVLELQVLGSIYVSPGQSICRITTDKRCETVHATQPIQVLAKVSTQSQG